MKNRDGEQIRKARLLAQSTLPAIPRLTSQGSSDCMKDIAKFIARRAAERDFAQMLEAEKRKHKPQDL